YCFRVDSTAGPGCPLKVEAEVRSDQSPPYTPGLTQVPVVPGQPRLEVLKVVDKAASEPGQILSYRVAVRNIGSAAADDVFVRDPLSPFVEYIPGTTFVFDQPVPDVGGRSALETGL